MVRGAIHRYTYAEYVAFEETSNVKHEYLDGEIYAMAGGTPEHAALAFALGGILRAQLGGNCRGYTSDLRVRVPQRDLAAYPDLTIVCGEMMRDTADRMAVTNPTVLVEVLSDSTEDYDRSEKREHYQQIPSLREYLVVSHRERRLDVWRRAEGEWVCESAGPGEMLRLQSIGCSVPVDELYRGVF